MKTQLKIVAATGVALLLSGCMLSSYTAVNDAAATMSAKYLDENGNLLAGVDAPDWDDVPAEGSATYNGFIAGEVAGDGVAGELSMTTNFATDLVTGTADNFYHEVDGAYTGALDVTGTVNRGAPAAVPQITANAAGTLTDSGGADQLVSLALDGDFVGTGYEAVGGYADGTIGAGTFEGIFVGE